MQQQGREHAMVKIENAEPKFAPTEPLVFERLPEAEQLQRSLAFYEALRKRRTVRDFSSAAVPYQLIENAIKAAASAPSGANQQPWKFVVVSNGEIKRKIREAAESEEKAFYGGRAPDEWLQALAALGTDWEKPFLETAPYLIVVFRIDYGLSTDSEGEEVKTKHYYVTESVGIATGMLLTALHMSGLATLTHTPSPMGFLAKILDRPRNEKPFLLIPVGYPAEGVTVPRITKKALSVVMQLVS
jgi:nitroreductase